MVDFFNDVLYYPLSLREALIDEKKYLTLPSGKSPKNKEKRTIK